MHTPAVHATHVTGTVSWLHEQGGRHFLFWSYPLGEKYLLKKLAVRSHDQVLSCLEIGPVAAAQALAAVCFGQNIGTANRDMHGGSAALGFWCLPSSLSLRPQMVAAHHSNCVQP